MNQITPTYPRVHPKRAEANIVWCLEVHLVFSLLAKNFTAPTKTTSTSISNP